MAGARPALFPPPLRALLASYLALACAGAAVLGAETAARPLLLSANGDARLELASGERVAAHLAAGGVLVTAVALETGWLAAGTQPAADGSSSRELLLLLGDGKAVSSLPLPSGRTATREQPLPLVEEGHLAGLVWLEGANRQSFGVRFAAWTGMAWGAVETIAGPGPGSQLALTAARVRDGSWLLAWSAFDGTDDEIVWSRGRDGVWSRPQRAAADNAVPDITPALAAAGSGALLAWSRYDAALGEYRIVVSRFANGRWTAPAAAGPAGSLYPTFEAAEAHPLLLFRTASPRGWEAQELNASGTMLRRAVVFDRAAAESARPVAAADGGSVTFRWPSAAVERTAAWSSR